MKNFSCWSALAASLLLLPAAASGHDYSYVEGGFINQDQGRRSRGDADGFRMAGSLDLGGPPLALIGEFVDTGDFSHLSGGLLFHRPVSDVIDLNAGATFEYMDTGRDDDLGAGLRGGVRWLVLPGPRNFERLEATAELRHLFIFSDSLTSLRASALYRIADNLDAQGAIQAGDDDRIEAGLRYTFGAGRSDATTTARRKF
jgi:hypothetical protein